MNIVEFGKGTTLIMPVITENENHVLEYGRIFLQEGKGCGTVGKTNSGNDFRMSKKDFVLKFTNTASIDVLIRSLNDLKEMMGDTYKGKVIEYNNEI